VFRLAGRERELARVEAFVAASSGGARGLLIVGEAGIGKTAIWRVALDRLRAAGHLVLVTRPAEEELQASMVGLFDLFESLAGVDVEPAVLDRDTDLFDRGRAVRLPRCRTDTPAVEVRRADRRPVGAGGPGPVAARPRHAAGAAEGDAVELVEFVRDERANLGWAGELVYEAIDGRRRRRMDEWRANGTAAAVDDGEEDATAWRYGFGGDGPPPLWVPLVPERPDPADPAVVLRRARMREWDRLPDDAARLRGRILTPDRPFSIDEVELPRSGLTVSRSYQTTRDRWGRLRTWSGRRKRLGRGERTLGTRYDRIVN
jgi:AAA ATPase domain